MNLDLTLHTFTRTLSLFALYSDQGFATFLLYAYHLIEWFGESNPFSEKHSQTSEQYKTICFFLSLPFVAS